MNLLLLKRTTWICLLSAAALPAGALDVRAFGAKGDGASKDTAALQHAIDAAEIQGGGVVEVPAGRYLSGTIRLKSNVTLQLDNGAVILGSPDKSDYDAYEPLPFKSASDNETTYFRYGLVTAENVHNIAIVGQGVIDGNRTDRGGPKTVAIKLCQFVTIRGITVRNSPNYSISLWGSDNVDIDGVNVLNGYADGIDPDSCRFVRIANSYIDSRDDAICAKASPSVGRDNIRPVEHLTVTNCTMRTECSGFKFGTETSGDFRHVAVSNCTITRREGKRRPNSGISLEAVDGAHIDGVVISNIEMTDVDTPVFIRLGNRGRDMTPPVPGSVRNVSIQNVVVTNALTASSVTGLPGHPVQNVQLGNLQLGMAGGVRESKSLDVNEREASYPEGHMWGQLPGYGLYVRHVDGLALTNSESHWDAEDVRPALVFDDVRDVTISGFRALTLARGAAALWLNNVAGALITGSQSGDHPLMRISGDATRDVLENGNAFARKSEPVK